MINIRLNKKHQVLFYNIQQFYNNNFVTSNLPKKKTFEIKKMRGRKTKIQLHNIFSE